MAGVGAMLDAVPGHLLAEGDPILTLYVNDESSLPRALALIDEAIAIDDVPMPHPSLFLGEVPRRR